MGVPLATVGRTAGVAVEIEDRNEILVWGYTFRRWKIALTAILSVFTLGLFSLVLHWKPVLFVQFLCDACPLESASIVLVRDDCYRWSLRRVYETCRGGGYLYLQNGGVLLEHYCLRYFTYRKQKFVWSTELKRFFLLTGYDQNITVHDMHNHDGWTSEHVDRLAASYGPNEINIELKSPLQLLISQAINPFYMFQLFSVTIWFSDTYYYYASIIVVLSVVSLFVDVYQIRKNQLALHNSIHKTDFVGVIRDGIVTTVSSTQLVPGDVIVIPNVGCVMTCDAVLIAGNCMLNESGLTGESMPVTKTALPVNSAYAKQMIYMEKYHAKHTLYSGTEVLQTRYYPAQLVKAIVTRTGFNTQKGQLVRSIMYPKPVDFAFTKDLLRFLFVLALLASVGMLYTIVLMGMRGCSIGKILVRALDLITICVPPALPAAMTIGIIAAESRLKKRLVYCISPNTLNTCGGINVVCFDKTGTLTEDGLNFLGAVSVSERLELKRLGWQKLYGFIFSRTFNGDLEDVDKKDASDGIVRCMASCHSLTRIDGKLVGDPLDLVMFKQSGWMLEEPAVNETAQFDTLVPTLVNAPDRSCEIGILKQFPFSSDLQRMSVLTRELSSSNIVLYCKGAPETVAKLCVADSLPSDYEHTLSSFTRKGYRVLALATRRLEAGFIKTNQLPREQVECEMDFLGLLVMDNRLKPETQPVINALKKANIRSVMVTGDNILTAVCVARECSIVDPSLPLYFVECVAVDGKMEVRLCPEEGSVHRYPTNPYKLDPTGEKPMFVKLEKNYVKRTYELAISGTVIGTIAEYFPHLIPKLVCMCNVFARMSPEQKTHLVNILQEMDYTVAMCGDGANDCGALKAAHAGISLSESEASIASPFTSKKPNIECVIDVIREGRAALTTSFGVFKYMAGYSLTQFLSVCLLYWLGTNMADFQFLLIDAALITMFSLFFGRTEASEVLAPKPPPVRILSVSSVASLFLQLLLMLAFQVTIFIYVTTQPWFVPHTYSLMGEVYPSYRASCVFMISIFQYITLVVVYSKSHPHRKTMMHNKLFFASIVVGTILCVVITVAPPDFAVELLVLKVPVDFKFRLFILLMAGVNFVACILTENFIVDLLIPKLTRHFKCGSTASPRYCQELSRVAGSIAWLDVSRKVEATDAFSLVKRQGSVSPTFAKNGETELLYRMESVKKL
ncbi:cation transporting ATPase 13A3 [Trichuris trichiura]|uniref:Cation-transporting ATPase n=1 Tax=Trichuris trichiura TaxID=36087 RepID=A0A077YZL0_TRITR|nr:cation transporting ATPase 13A3 [Trichuris trichiura]